MAERHVKLCSVDGCPAADDDDWHRCFIDSCRKQSIDHQHFPKKSLAGKGAKIVAALCSYHHDRIDKHYWQEGVLNHGDGTIHYWVKNAQGENQCDRVIGHWKPEEASVDEPVVSLSMLEDTPDEPLTVERFREWLDSEPMESQENRPELPEPQETALAPREERLPVQYLPTGLVLPENLSFDKWQELVGTLKGMIGGVPWWAGDLVNFGERKYGERYAQAMNDLGLKYERLANYAWVASKVELSTRVESLSWSHHREVADLEPKEQRAWLQRAQDEGLTANALRKAICGEEPERCTESATGRHHYVCEHCGKER